MKSYKDITFRYLKMQKKRTILTIIGIILSVALISAIGTMIVSMREALLMDAVESTGDYHAAFYEVEGDKVDKIRNNVGVDKVGVKDNVIWGIMSKMSDEEKELDSKIPDNRYLMIQGYNKEALNMFNVNIKEGRLPKKSNEIVLEYWAPNYMDSKPKIDDKIKVPIGNLKSNENNPEAGNIFKKTGEKEFTIVGFIQNKGTLVGNYYSTAITFLDDKDVSTNKDYIVCAKMNSIKNIHKDVKNIGKELGLKGVIKYNEKVLRLSAKSLNKSINKSLVLMLIFIVGLIIVATVAVIYNTFNISVLERISQFGLLRCVGSSPQQIRQIVFKEAGILSLIGIPVGLVCGVFAMQVVVYIIKMIDIGEIGGLTNLKIVVSPTVMIISSIVGLFTVFLSVFGPSKKAGKISPLEAIRNTGNLKKGTFKRVKSSRLVGAIFKIEGTMAYKNLKRNKKRFRITVFSIIISIVLYITFSSFVSFMFSINVVDESEVADFYLQLKGQNMEFSDSTYNELKRISGVDKVYKGLQRDAVVLAPESKINPNFKKLKPEVLNEKQDNMIKLYDNEFVSYGDESLDVLKSHLKQGSINKEALNKENGVLILQENKIQDTKAEKFVILDTLKYKVGDKIKMAIDNGSDNLQYKDVKVMGVLDSAMYGSGRMNGGISIITTEKVFKDITGRDDYKDISIKLKKNADRNAINNYLKEFKQKTPGFEYMDCLEAAKQTRNINIVMSIFLYGFVAVIALIGCLNIINTISTNLILRTKELSVLRAVGMTHEGIKKMVCLESILYGIISSIYGSIIGTGLSYLLYMIYKEILMFEWSIPWNFILQATLGSILITLLSSIVPLKRINEANIIENIRGEE